jgi:D-alanyl-D-alanine carboxypeptidase
LSGDGSRSTFTDSRVPFRELLVELLCASNNYIANQVFLEIGAHRLGGPVSRKKSLQVAMLAAHGLAAALGSGISRNNRSPPAASPTSGSVHVSKNTKSLRI